MLITEEYRRLNAQKHDTCSNFGSHGANFAEQVKALAREIGAHTILDYGCGKRTLERALGYAIANYDPAVPGCDKTPEPADIVVCTDVLEHIEPECLSDVLDDLKRVTKHTILLTINMMPAIKHLADGRNAHLIIEGVDWWLPKLMERFDLMKFDRNTGEFLALMRAKGMLAS